MSDIETPTQIQFEHLLIDICAAPMCEVQISIHDAKPRSSC